MVSHPMKKLFLALLLTFSLPSWAGCRPSLGELPSLLLERASLMKEVAAYKWLHATNHQAVPYSARQERGVLLTAYHTANKLGLSPASVMLFSQIQMDFSKQIEYDWIQRWNTLHSKKRALPTLNSTPDLDQLRRRIHDIDIKLFPTLKAQLSHIHACDASRLEAQLQTTLKPITDFPEKSIFMKMYARSIQQIHEQ